MRASPLQLRADAGRASEVEARAAAADRQLAAVKQQLAGAEGQLAAKTLELGDVRAELSRVMSQVVGGRCQERDRRQHGLVCFSIPRADRHATRLDSS
jgi:hypothetical protein